MRFIFLLMLLGALSAEAQNNVKKAKQTTVEAVRELEARVDAGELVVRPAAPPVGYARHLGRLSIELPDAQRPTRPTPTMSPAWRSLHIAEPPFNVAVLVYSPDAPECAGRVYIARLMRVVYEGDNPRYDWAEGYCGASLWAYAVTAWMPIVEPEKLESHGN